MVEQRVVNPTVQKERGLWKLVHVLVFFSGASALIYESLWLRSFGLIFGNTTYAVSIVLATFMGGLAVGSYFVTRVSFRKTLLAYSCVEIGIGLSALLTLPFLRYLPHWYGAFLQNYPLSSPTEMTLKIVLASLVLLPPTLLLGSTIPLMMEFLSRKGRHFHGSLGLLYLLNTLGGAVGVFVCGFILIPRIGVSKTYLCTAALNLIIGFFAWIFARRTCEPLSSVSKKKSQFRISVYKGLPALFVLIALFSGISSFGLEVLWTRSFTLIIGSSTYSFNLMLLAFLMGIVIGVAVYEFTWKKIHRPLLWLSVLLLILGLLILINVYIIGLLPDVFFRIMRQIPISFSLYQIVGYTLCFLDMLLITTLFGFMFPLIAQLVRQENFRAQVVSGFLYAWNTIGAIIGSLVVGFFLIPTFGIQTSFIWIAVFPLYVGLITLFLALSWPMYVRAVSMVAFCIVITTLLIGYKPWNTIMMSCGIYKYGMEWSQSVAPNTPLEDIVSMRQMLFYKEGREGVVSVVEHNKNRFLTVNGKYDAGTSIDVITQKLCAHIPLMLHPDPKKVFIIGWGSGCSVGAATLYPVESIECAEIEPAVYESAPLFTGLNREAYRDPRFTISFTDGRNHLLTTPALYDVIISEPSNPWITGVSNLFTTDFYKIALSRLADDGIICHWFHYYDMSLKDLQIGMKTFTDVFPYVSMWMIPPPLTDIVAPMGKIRAPYIPGDLLLVGSKKPHRLDFEKISHFYRDKRIGYDLRSMGLEDEISFMCNYLMDKRELEVFSGDVVGNSDDLPHIEFSAPKSMYVKKQVAIQISHKIHQALEKGSTRLLPPIDNFAPLDKRNEKEQATIYRVMAECYLEKTMLDKSLALCEKSLKLKGDSPQIYAVMGEAYFNQYYYLYNAFKFKVNTEKAEKTLLKAISLDPSLKRAYEILGTIYYLSRDYQKAVGVYEELVRHYPNYSMGYFGLSLIHYSDRNFQEAREYALKAQTLDMGNTSVSKLLKLLKERD